MSVEVRSWRGLERFGAEGMEKVNLFETERCFCDLYCLRPGQAQKLHTHAASDKVYAVLRGEVVATVGAESRPLLAGEAVLARAGEPHGVRNGSGEDAVCLVFMAPHPGFKPRPSSGS
ncbi:MAG: cupin domain-containing protein [Thermoanaerobaculia bacterium]